MNAISPSSLPLLLVVALAVAGRGVAARPNVIIMQPDDLPFLDPWTPSPNSPIKPNKGYPFPDNGLPNIESLRTGGLQMKQAYAVSPVCGTSRYATITGKYPSRAASVRQKADSSPATVTIPTTKLQDIDGQNDCSEENLAVAFQNEGYSTAMIGKWHLSKINANNYSYESAVEIVKGCGFDHVGGLYVENLGQQGTSTVFNDGSFSHNMEWVTYEAVEFIKDNAKPSESEDDDSPFFMYFNPTVPHGHHDIKYALENFTCRDTADLDSVDDEDYLVNGMTDITGGCAAYRQTIFDRSKTDEDLGKIWLDDSVGALLIALEDAGVLDDTIFIFQEDHGMGAKGTLYDNGSRIPQFVHYPNEIEPLTTFEGVVTNLDIAATVFDYAGITPPYDIDGKSWKDVIKGDDTEQESYWKDDRCIFLENENDRAVRCGCFKYIEIADDKSTTYTRGNEQGYTPNIGGNLFDLCGGTDEYVTTSDDNQEEETIVNDDAETDLTEALNCHLGRTDPDSNPDFSICGPDECKDETKKFKYVTNKGETKKKKCTWVAKKKTSNRCKIEIKDSDLKVKHVCPKTCGKC